MTEIGPIQLLAIGFGPGAEYKGQILRELENIEGKSLIRVLDVFFVGANSTTGEVVAFDDQSDALGGLVGALLGSPFTGVEGKPMAARLTVDDRTIGLTRGQLEDILRTAPPDIAIGLLLIEHVWARDLKRSIRESGGMPLVEGFLSTEVIADIAAELEQRARLLDELEQEERHEQENAAAAPR
jgi:hypothetical protein